MKKIWRNSLFMLALLPFFTYQGASAAEALNFNTATAQEIAAATDGVVDEALAQAIVEYRGKTGSFKKAEDLRNVPGMTSVIFGMLAPTDSGGEVIYESEIPTEMHSY